MVRGFLKDDRFLFCIGSHLNSKKLLHSFIANVVEEGGLDIINGAGAIVAKVGGHIRVATLEPKAIDSSIDDSSYEIKRSSARAACVILRNQLHLFNGIFNKTESDRYRLIFSSKDGQYTSLDFYSNFPESMFGIVFTSSVGMDLGSTAYWKPTDIYNIDNVPRPPWMVYEEKIKDEQIAQLVTLICNSVFGYILFNQTSRTTMSQTS